jgi:hypothetical protein
VEPKQSTLDSCTYEIRTKQKFREFKEVPDVQLQPFGGKERLQ